MEIEVREINYNGMNAQDINQNNIKALTPFINHITPEQTPKLYILQNFYDKLTVYPFVMDAMNTYYSSNIHICDILPSELESNDDTGYWMVYRAWCRMYNADIWYSVFGNLVEIVYISPEEQDILKSCNELSDAIIQLPTISKLIIRLDQQINNLQKNTGQQELFVKTSAKSTKHDVKVQPITTGIDALNYLLSSPTIQGVLTRNESVELFLRPWNSEVNNDNEIRVFIQDGHIKAVSQQYIYASSPVLGMMFRSKITTDEILDKITTKWKQISMITGYKDAVLDMFITSDCDVELIEINCGGNGWGPAGSSLFQWQEINEIPDGKCVFAFC